MGEVRSPCPAQGYSAQGHRGQIASLDSAAGVGGPLRAEALAWPPSSHFQPSGPDRTLRAWGWEMQPGLWDLGPGGAVEASLPQRAAPGKWPIPAPFQRYWHQDKQGFLSPQRERCGFLVQTFVMLARPMSCGV